MKVLIFGNGYVGGHFLTYYGKEAILSSHRIGDYSALLAELKSQMPDVVINAVGKTGVPNVDWCETHKMETLFANVEVPILLARACEELGLYMVHVGSGCVYEGTPEGTPGGGFTEEDEPNFDGSFYSKTKAWSEAILKEFPVLQLRVRMPLDSMPGPRNFVTKITKYKKVISVPNSITIMEDFLAAADQLIRKREHGIFNMTNPGSIEHKEILDMYKEIVDKDFEYELFSVEEMEKITVARRSNCSLSTKKLENLGISMRPVKTAVRETLQAYAQNML